MFTESDEIIAESHNEGLLKTNCRSVSKPSPSSAKSLLGESSGPVRTCIGSRKRAPQSDLIRVSLSDGGAWTISGPGGLTKQVHLGRSIYFLPATECIANGTRLKQLRYSLKQEVSPKQAESLVQLLNERIQLLNDGGELCSQECRKERGKEAVSNRELKKKFQINKQEAGRN